MNFWNFLEKKTKEIWAPKVESFLENIQIVRLIWEIF